MNIYNKNACGFSLVELLVVMAIIAMMIGVAIPAFNTINKGSSMRTAELQVVSGCMLARQSAISKRGRVVFCIPTQVVSGTSENPVRTNMLYRSYFVCAEEMSGSGGIGFSDQVVGKVEQLPKGIIFTNTWNGTWFYPTITDFVLKSPTTGNILTKGVGFRYAPEGSIYWKDATDPGLPASTPIYIALVNGMVPESGSNAGNPVYQSSAVTSTVQVRKVSGKPELVTP